MNTSLTAPAIDQESNALKLGAGYHTRTRITPAEVIERQDELIALLKDDDRRVEVAVLLGSRSRDTYNAIWDVVTFARSNGLLGTPFLSAAEAALDREGVLSE